MKSINNPYFLWVEVVVEEVSLYFLGVGPIQYFGLDPIDRRSSFHLKTSEFLEFFLNWYKKILIFFILIK